MRHVPIILLALLTLLLLGCGERSAAHSDSTVSAIPAAAPTMETPTATRSITPLPVAVAAADPQDDLIRRALQLEIALRQHIADHPERGGPTYQELEALMNRIADWQETPGQGAWRDRYFPPTNVSPPDAMLALGSDEAWNARATPVSGPRASALRVADEIRHIPEMRRAMEFLLDTGITDTTAAMQAVALLGGNDVIAWAPMTILLHFDPALAHAVMATVLGGERAPTGPG